MIINREGQTFELTPEELEQAYRERLRQYTEEDAEVHFLARFDGEPESAEDVSAEEKKNFADEYGFTVLDAVNPDSENYILGDLADRYEHDHDCNIDENSMWRDLIDDYLAEICR